MTTHLHPEQRRNSDTKVWIVDDNVGDQILIQELLIDLDFRAKNIRLFDRVSDMEDPLKTETPDVLLLDLFLPESRGIETYSLLRKFPLHFPVIVLSGIADMNTALETVKMGAQDYLIKDELSSEIIDKMITYSIERFANILQLQRSQENIKCCFNQFQ